MLAVVIVVSAACAVGAAHAAGPPAEIGQALADLGSGDAAVREGAVRRLGARNDPMLLPLFEALREGSVYVWKRAGGRAEIVIGGEKSMIGDTEVMALARAWGGEPL